MKTPAAWLGFSWPSGIWTESEIQQPRRLMVPAVAVQRLGQTVPRGQEVGAQGLEFGAAHGRHPARLLSSATATRDWGLRSRKSLM